MSETYQLIQVAERTGITNAQFVCEIGNVNTAENIKFHTDFHVFFFLASTLNSVCVIVRYQLSYWNIQFLRKAVFVFKACRSSASAFCLLCMQPPGFPPVPQGFHVPLSVHLTFNLRIFCHNWQWRKSSRCYQCCLCLLVSLCPRVLGPGLLQANLSLFGPLALIYLSDSIGNQTVL